MTLPGDAPEPPARRRTPWSFRSLVEDVSGRPLADFQDPPAKPQRPPPVASNPRAEVIVPAAAMETVPGGSIGAVSAGPSEALDPVARVYPPLSGPTGRSLHGSEGEHHAETLRSVEGPEEHPAVGARPHRPGPSRRPERIYLHYLLLHLDRLNDGALRYLKNAVDEEMAHREPARPPEGPPASG